MSRRLFYLAPLFMLIASLAVNLWQPGANAASAEGFSYSDGSFQNIVGPIGSNGGGSGTYKSSGEKNGNYAYADSNYVDPDTNPAVNDGGPFNCTSTITVASPGSTNGQLNTSCPQESVNNNSSITIAVPSGGNGGSTGGYSGVWTDHSHIVVEVDNTPLTFLDNQIDDDLNFKLMNAPDDCSAKDQVYGFSHPGADDANATATVKLQLWSASGGVGDNTCIQSNYSIVLSDSNNAYQDYFTWQDSGTISTSDGTGMVFTTSSSNSTTFLSTGGTDSKNTTCQSEIDPDSDNLSGQLTLRYNSSTPQLYTGWPATISKAPLSKNDGCYVSAPIPITIADPTVNGVSASSNTSGSSALGQDSNTSGASAPSLSCNAGINPLNWLVCGVVDGLTKVIGGVDSAINSQLAVGTTSSSNDSPIAIFSPGSGGQAGKSSTAYYKAWSSFRDIALGLMVVAGLVFIIAEALGFETVDAYTMRKILPRIIISAIAITLSWSLMEFFVQFTNDMGYGIRSLIYAPFSGGGFSTTVNLSGVQGLGVSLATGTAMTALGVFGLLSFVATGAMAVFVAFLVLIIRQIVIIFLILLAPIALVAYILPRTHEIFKLWWDSFSKALLMFPLISAFIAAGRVFSEVALSANRNDPFDQFIGFAAYFAPYFLLPATFKLAGGALRQIGGFVNDRNRGSFDRLRKYRSNKITENMQKAGNYQRFSDRNFATRGLNTTLGAAFNPRNVIRGRRGIQQGRQSGRSAQGAAAFKDNKVVQANGADDNFLLALTNEDMAKEKLVAARSNLLAAQASGNVGDQRKYEAEVSAREQGLNAARQVEGRKSAGMRIAALDALTKTGYQFEQGKAGYDELDRAVTSITKGDSRARTKLMDNSQYNLRAHGQRFDLGGINHGAGYDPGLGLGKGSLYEIANAKTQSIAEMVDSLPAGPADHAHAVTYKELQAMLPNSKGANRDEIVKRMEELENRDVGPYMNTATGAVDASGALITNQARINYDLTLPGAASWSSVDVARGWRTERRAQTFGDLAQAEARTYERPDPNHI